MAKSPAPPPSESASSWRERLFQPVDIASGVIFRIVFGLMIAWDLLYYLLDGRLERFYLNPVILFKYPGFDWVEVASPGAMRFLFWTLFAAALAVAFGWFYRLATVVLFCGLTYVYLLASSTYNNHNYLFCLFALLLIFLPLHRSNSIDAWRRPTRRSSTVPAWVIWLLRFQVGVPYFFGGIAKLNEDWLLHAQPMRMWFETGNMGGSLKFDFFKETWAAYLFSWGGVFFDLLIVPALLWRRTRPFAIALAALFHLTNAQIFNIGIFPWIMLLASTIFFSPGWPRRVGLIRKPTHSPEKDHGKKKAAAKKVLEAETSGTNRRLVEGALAVYVLFQCLMPFRHWLYPGNVDWTDEGHRYAWRMKLRDKQGEIKFLMVKKDNRQSIMLEDSEALLTKRQQRYLSQDPEVARQFAHFLARQLREKGHTNFEIRALTNLSLNGREPQPLIDPEVDLTAQPGGFGHKSWLLPLVDD